MEATFSYYSLSIEAFTYKYYYLISPILLVASQEPLDINWQWNLPPLTQPVEFLFFNFNSLILHYDKKDFVPNILPLNFNCLAACLSPDWDQACSYFRYSHFAYRDFVWGQIEEFETFQIFQSSNGNRIQEVER